jgi:hypothetical protein
VAIAVLAILAVDAFAATAEPGSSTLNAAAELGLVDKFEVVLEGLVVGLVDDGDGVVGVGSKAAELAEMAVLFLFCATLDGLVNSDRVRCQYLAMHCSYLTSLPCSSKCGRVAFFILSTLRAIEMQQRCS